MEIYVSIGLALGVGYIIGSFVEWSQAMKREDRTLARLHKLYEESAESERVIAALREIIAKGVVRP